MKHILGKNIKDDKPRQAGFRDICELLESRIGLLDDKQRQIMAMRIRQGASFRQIAMLTGSHEASVARRVHKITASLLKGAFIDCLRNRARLTDEQLAIARDRFLLKLILTDIARKQNCTLYHVRLVLSQLAFFLADSNTDDKKTA